MVGELITLPLRIGVGATRLWLRATGETVAVAADATGRLIDKVTGNRAVAVSTPPIAPQRDVSPTPPEVGPSAPEVGTARTPLVPDAHVATDTQAGAGMSSADPVHVSEEPELVEQLAESGAEDGAGATIHVNEPWTGYEQLRAEDVIDRLAGASPAELAAIQLYESGNRGRVTVLAAVERELRISSSSGSHS
jgi:hypothetical protein